DRDHARLAVRVLAWPVDVAVPQRDVLESVDPVVVVEVVLRRELRHAVRRERRLRRRLGRWPLRRLAVDNAAGRDEDEPARAVPQRALGDVQEPVDVDARVAARIGDGHAHVDLRGVVIDDVEAARLLEYAGESGIADVELDEACAGRDVLGAAGAQVVDDPDAISAREVRFSDVPAYETGPARDQDRPAHSGPPPSSPKRYRVV